MDYPTQEQIFRNNVAYAKMSISPEYLDVMRGRLLTDDLDDLSPKEVAAIELILSDNGVWPVC